MRSQSNKYSHNINIQLSDNQTSNNPQNLWSPFIYDLQNGGVQNLAANTQSVAAVDNAANANVSVEDGLLTQGEPSQPTLNYHNSFLQSRGQCHKRWSNSVGQNDEQQPQHVTRNVRQRLRPHSSQPSFPHENLYPQITLDCYKAANANVTVEGGLPTQSEPSQAPLPHQNSFLQSRVECRKRSSNSVRQNDEHQTQQSEYVTRNVRRRVGQQNLHTVSADDAAFSGSSVLPNEENQHTSSTVTFANPTEGPQSTRRPSSAQNSTPGGHRKAREHVHNVQHRLGSSNVQAASYHNSGLCGQDSSSMSNEENLHTTSIINTRQSNEGCQAANPTTATQQSRRGRQRKGRGNAHNVGQRVRSQNSQPGSDHGSGPSAEEPSVPVNEDISPSYQDLGNCNER